MRRETLAGQTIHPRVRQAWLFLAATAAIFICCALFYWQVGAAQDDRRTKDRRYSAPVVANLTVKASYDKTGTEDFFREFARLDDAVNQFAGEKPADVLTRVRDENTARGLDVCPFAWDSTGATLLFADDGAMELDAVMGRCADAVEETIARR